MFIPTDLQIPSFDDAVHPKGGAISRGFPEVRAGQTEQHSTNDPYHNAGEKLYLTEPQHDVTKLFFPSYLSRYLVHLNRYGDQAESRRTSAQRDATPWNPWREPCRLDSSNSLSSYYSNSNTNKVNSMPLDRPIPSFYCCYFLRSTVSKTGAYYIGSTPNPVRRLRQHNGLSKGGAVRTSKMGLRPWEMGCIVTGFPSHIAALQFEWAWQNPHISTHIPAESRISIATAKKKSGHAKRPRLTLISGLSNLHLLLRMPSFVRWPLEIRFFNRDVHKAWQKWTKESPAALPESIQIITDFPPKTGVTAVEAPLGQDTKRRKLKGGSVQVPGSPGTKRTKLNYGIDALSVDYANEKSHVEKAKLIVDFEQEGSCSICNIELEHDGGLYAICPSENCNSVTHLTCLSTHFLDNDDDTDALVPTDGTCPACKSKIRWIDVVKELTLRIRGQKEIEKLLKVKRARKMKEISASQAADDDSELSDEELEEQIEAELRELQRLNPELGDSYLDFERDASDESDTGSIARAAPSQAASTKGRHSHEHSHGKNSLVTVIEDSDWDEAEVLDQ